MTMELNSLELRGYDSRDLNTEYLSKIKTREVYLIDHSAEDINWVKDLPRYQLLKVGGSNIVDLSGYTGTKNSGFYLNNLRSTDYSTLNRDKFTELKIQGEQSSEGLDKAKATQIYLDNPS